jgi:hypothetical protein
MKKAVVVSMCIGIVTFSGCNTLTAQGDGMPAWLETKIEHCKTQSVTNPPQSVVKYYYNNTTVYHFPAVCCDQYGVLYSENGDTICLPDGGIDGKGDGRCSDFFQTLNAAGVSSNVNCYLSGKVLNYNYFRYKSPVCAYCQIVVPLMVQECV